jgi:hypothetical protein
MTSNGIKLPTTTVTAEDSFVLKQLERDYPGESSSYLACALRCRIRERQLLSALERVAELEDLVKFRDNRIYKLEPIIGIKK